MPIFCRRSGPENSKHIVEHNDIFEHCARRAPPQWPEPEPCRLRQHRVLDGVGLLHRADRLHSARPAPAVYVSATRSYTTAVAVTESVRRGHRMQYGAFHNCWPKLGGLAQFWTGNAYQRQDELRLRFGPTPLCNRNLGSTHPMASVNL